MAAGLFADIDQLRVGPGMGQQHRIGQVVVDDYVGTGQRFGAA
jgi:hypothetical protein